MKLVKTVKNFYRYNETGKTCKKLLRIKFSKTHLVIGYRTAVADGKKSLRKN